VTSAGFEGAIPRSERPRTYAKEGAATGIGNNEGYNCSFYSNAYKLFGQPYFLENRIANISKSLGVFSSRPAVGKRDAAHTKIRGKLYENPIREKVAILIILLVFCVNFVFFYSSDNLCVLLSLNRCLALDNLITLISQVACASSVSANEISALFKSGKAKLEIYFASAQLLYECWVSFEIQQGFQQIYGM